ncbi:MAG: type II toxin-antitoxin system VapC family toxin [Chitinispirillaceae bacterium]|nr:type II toxin-antitoxin system VapC family toxin [Chitinispirillaceae bacterium]
MNYLIDTCVVSELIKDKPDRRVAKWIDGCDEESLYLSVLTIGEIRKGIAKLNAGARKSLLQKWLDSDLRQRFLGRVLPVSEAVAVAWGDIQGRAEAAGAPLPTIDGLLGATAIVHRCAIATRDESGIAPTGAPVVNPWA